MHPPDTPSPNARILLIDDHPLYRSATASALRARPGGDRLAIDEVGSAADAAALPAGPVYDGIVLDLHMPDLSGLEAFRLVAERFDGTRIVILSSDDQIDTVCRMIEAGAAGYVFKTASGEAVAEDIMRAISGELRLPESVARELAHRHLRGPQWADARHADTFDAPVDPSIVEMARSFGLTLRQSEVLHGMHAGGSNKHIARQLAISERTVKFHLSAAYGLLGANNRTDALVIMQRAGFPRPGYRAPKPR